MWAQRRALQNRQDEGQSHLHKKSQLDDTSLMENGESQGRFAQVSNPSHILQYRSRQTRCPKIQRHTPDKTRFQSGKGRILVIRYSLMRIMGLFELEWGWWNLHSWNKWTICRQRSAIEGLVHVDDGIETGSRSRSSIDKKYYSPLYRDYLLYSAHVFVWAMKRKMLKKKRR